MSHEQKQESAPSSVTPVVTWEQPSERSPKDSSSNNVIDINTYRRQNAKTIDSEATVTVREFPTIQNEEPVQLIVISSGFGQKHTVHTNTVQCKVA